MKMTDLLIILGSPASGKTTLARRLSAGLGLPCLCKDDVKEALFDVLGAADRAESRRLSDASFAAQLRLARTQLEAGVSCIVEGNWRAEHAEGVRAITAAPRREPRRYGAVRNRRKSRVGSPRDRATPATWTRASRRMRSKDPARHPARTLI